MRLFETQLARSLLSLAALVALAMAGYVVSGATFDAHGDDVYAVILLVAHGRRVVT